MPEAFDELFACEVDYDGLTGLYDVRTGLHARSNV